tara:strand:- start:21681 stop:21872 length:192 start_codon:yes stop_codon:yes gene_type:complete
MKRKPDAMIALIALFFIGLVVSGFSSLTVGSSRLNIEGASLHYPLPYQESYQENYQEKDRMAK